MDILRVLAAPDLEVRKKVLNLALDLVSSRNIEEVCCVSYKSIPTDKEQFKAIQVPIY